MTKTTNKPEPFKPEVLDELLAGMSSPEELMGDAGLFKQLKKALMERVLSAELTHHLGYEKGDPAGQGSGNSRNGHSARRSWLKTARSTWRSRATGPARSSLESCRRA
jgi:transposase-like protein